MSRENVRYWGGLRWECEWLSDDAFSIICMRPQIDAHGIDQTDWPTDEQVSEAAGAPVRYFDAGDSMRGVEGIYNRR